MFGIYLFRIMFRVYFFRIMFRLRDIDSCVFPHNAVCDIKCWEFEMEHF